LLTPAFSVGRPPTWRRGRSPAGRPMGRSPPARGGDCGDTIHAPVAGGPIKGRGGRRRRGAPPDTPAPATPAGPADAAAAAAAVAAAQ